MPDFGYFKKAIDSIGMQWMGSVFLLSFNMFIADLICGFGFLLTKQVTRIRMWGLVCGLIMVVVANVQGLRPPIIERHNIVIKGLPADMNGTTIAVMSDLHIGNMIGSVWLNARIDQVQALQPDCIVLVGDLFERDCDPGEMIPVMQRLSAPLGVWAVRGNHDALRPDRPDVTGNILSGAGIRLLSNQAVSISNHLVLAGIDDLTSSRRQPGEGEFNLMKTLTHRPPGPAILLSHTPWLTDRASAAGVDFMISGHTHNGQIWPFSYLVRMRYPFIGGIYTIDNMTLLVSRGTGTWGPRMRLWAPGEITFMSLRSS